MTTRTEIHREEAAKRRKWMHHDQQAYEKLEAAIALAEKETP